VAEDSSSSGVAAAIRPTEKDEETCDRLLFWSEPDESKLWDDFDG